MLSMGTDLETRVANKLLKRAPVSLAVRKVQIKIMRHRLGFKDVKHLKF